MHIVGVHRAAHIRGRVCDDRPRRRRCPWPLLAVRHLDEHRTPFFTADVDDKAMFAVADEFRQGEVISVCCFRVLNSACRPSGHHGLLCAIHRAHWDRQVLPSPDRIAAATAPSGVGMSLRAVALNSPYLSWGAPFET